MRPPAWGSLPPFFWPATELGGETRARWYVARGERNSNRRTTEASDRSWNPRAAYPRGGRSVTQILRPSSGGTDLARGASPGRLRATGDPKSRRRRSHEFEQVRLRDDFPDLPRTVARIAEER